MEKKRTLVWPLLIGFAVFSLATAASIGIRAISTMWRHSGNQVGYGKWTFSVEKAVERQGIDGVTPSSSQSYYVIDVVFANHGGRGEPRYNLRNVKAFAPTGLPMRVASEAQPALDAETKQPAGVRVVQIPTGDTVVRHMVFEGPTGLKALSVSFRVGGRVGWIFRSLIPESARIPVAVVRTHTSTMPIPDTLTRSSPTVRAVPKFRTDSGGGL